MYNPENIRYSHQYIIYQIQISSLYISMNPVSYNSMIVSITQNLTTSVLLMDNSM
jgi:hypothetical protein